MNNNSSMLPSFSDYWYGPPSQPVLMTPDCRITIVDRETLEIARKLLDRIEKKLLSPPPQAQLQKADSLEEFKKALIGKEKQNFFRQHYDYSGTCNNNINIPADFSLPIEKEKAKEYSRRRQKPVPKFKKKQ